MAYGTPAAPEDVEPYYTHIRRGRPPEPEQLADLERRYEALGGTSTPRPPDRRPGRGDRRRPRQPGPRPVPWWCSARSTPPRSSRTAPPPWPPRASTGWWAWCWPPTTPGFSVGRVPAAPGRGRRRRRGPPTSASSRWSDEPAWLAFTASRGHRRPGRPARGHQGAVHRPLASPSGCWSATPTPSLLRRQRPSHRPPGRAGAAGPAGAWPGRAPGARPSRGGVPTSWRSSATWPPPAGPTACWCARRASSPTTSRSATTSTSRPGAGRRGRPGLRPHPDRRRRRRGDGRPGRPGARRGRRAFAA